MKENHLLECLYLNLSVKTSLTEKIAKENLYPNFVNLASICDLAKVCLSDLAEHYLALI